MNDDLQEFNLIKKIYKDVINKYSIFELNNQKIYIKHLTDNEISRTYDKYLDFFKKARNIGLLNEKEKLELLYEKNIWNKEKEQKIELLKKEIKHNLETKRKLIIKAQIKSVENKIDKLEKELDALIKERSENLGITAEEYSTRKSNEYLIYLSFYKNENFDSLFESEEEFYNLEVDLLIKYASIYHQYNDLFSTENIKKLAASSFFINIFFLCENNPMIFFGRPITELTYNQINLFSVAKTYKYVLEKSGEYPPTYIEKLSDLVQWYESRSLGDFKSKNKNKSTDKEFSGQTYIGATEEEMKKMVSSSDEVIDLVKEAKKSNKDLSFEELLKIHGVK